MIDLSNDSNNNIVGSTSEEVIARDPTPMVSLMRRPSIMDTNRAVLNAYYEKRAETIRRIVRLNHELEPPLTISLLPAPNRETTESELRAALTGGTHEKGVQTEEFLDGITKIAIAQADRREGPLRGRRNVYTCNICGKEYTWRTSAMRHKKTEHEGLRFVCNFCETPYSTQHALKRHLTREMGGCRVRHYVETMRRQNLKEAAPFYDIRKEQMKPSLMGLPGPYQHITEFP